MKRLAIPLSILVTLAVALLIYVSAINTHQPAQIKVSNTSVATLVDRDELLEAVNAERAKVGVAPLVRSDKLEQSAQWKADRILATGNFEHIDPTTGKKDGIEYAASIEHGCTRIGENLASIETKDSRITTLGAIESWLSSDTHRAAMLNPDYKTTGFGFTEYSIVEHFCKP